jgi:uncharacterized membrane protein YkoI
MIKKLVLAAFGVISLVFAQSTFSAEQKRFSPPTKERQQMCTPVGKGAAMNAVARQTKGKVLSASLNTRSRPPVYRVRVVTDSGRVRHVYVNACTGRLA